MIYICKGAAGQIFFVENSEELDVDYSFLNSFYSVVGEIIGKIPSNSIIDDNVPKFKMEDGFKLIYPYIENEKYLFYYLEGVPKEFVRWLISKWKKQPEEYDLNILAKFEQELDSIYDNMMIKDIIE
jgi:hypothetical protein